LLPEVRERRDTALRNREFDREVQRIEKLWVGTPLSHRACGLGPHGHGARVRRYGGICRRRCDGVRCCVSQRHGLSIFGVSLAGVPDPA
jgi:hypothetical protein